VYVVLAIEEPDISAFYAAALTRAGFQVLAATPSRAVSVARHVKPDVIVIDAAREAGAGACSDFKADPQLGRIPLVALAPPDHGPLDPSCDLVLPVDCLDTELVEAIDRLLLRRRRTS
jgi:CheY-like chemotaxis protein